MEAERSRSQQHKTHDTTKTRIRTTKKKKNMKRREGYTNILSTGVVSVVCLLACLYCRVSASEGREDGRECAAELLSSFAGIQQASSARARRRVRKKGGRKRSKG